MQRRRFLAGLGLATGATVGVDPVVARGADGAGFGEESDRFVRGEAEVDLEVTDEEDDEHVEYLEDEGAVRYVKAWRSVRDDSDDDEPPEREPVYTTTDWERWARRRCLRAGARAAADHVDDALGLDGGDVGAGITGSIQGRDVAAFVTVWDPTAADDAADATTAEDSDDASDAVTLADVAAATPATVDVTYALDEQTHAETVPIYAELSAPEEPDEGTMTDDEVAADDGSARDDRADDGPADDGSATDDGVGGLDALPGFGMVAAVAAIGLGALANRGRDRS